MFHAAESLELLVLSPDNLLLDPLNPRLVDTQCQEDPFSDWEQEVVRRILVNSFSVRPLIESILRLGFLPMDRMVVRRHDKTKFVMVEGNRRLAAIKTILGDTKRKAIQPSAAVIDSLTAVEVLLLKPVTACDSAALLLQGVRHISGVKSWGPYQQGRLINSLVNDSKMSLREAALTVGLSPSRVSVLLHGYYGMQQMFENADYGHQANTAMFSCFEQSYCKLPVRLWLDWDEAEHRYTNEASLRIFYESIIPQKATGLPRLLARDVRNYLPSVLQHEGAKRAFSEENATIQQAYAMTHSAVNCLQPLIESANYFLSQMRIELPEIALNASEKSTVKKLYSALEQLLQQRAEK